MDDDGVEALGMIIVGRWVGISMLLYEVGLRGKYCMYRDVGWFGIMGMGEGGGFVHGM